MSDMSSVDVPHWTQSPDYFVWEAFDAASSDPAAGELQPDAAQQQALLAETHHFYVIPDQFGVVSGHLLILPKARQTSIAGGDEVYDAEITWLIHQVSTIVADEYCTQVVVAEHGECGCATAGQAHVHVVPLPSSTTRDDLRAAIDQTLQRRMVGIESVLYRDAEFTALEDLRALVGVDGAQIIGRQLRLDDIGRAVDYPTEARTVAGRTQPYVYFTGLDITFLTMRSLGSQFVREVVGTLNNMPLHVWNRHANVSRDNMFATFARLARRFGEFAVAHHGFRARAGRPGSQGGVDRAVTMADMYQGSIACQSEGPGAQSASDLVASR